MGYNMSRGFLLAWLLHVACASMYSLRECRTSTEGAEYMGRVGTTISGKTCQRWDVQFPHSHNFQDPRLYPDNNLNLSANYCRNPDLDKGPWCYTTDPDTRYEFCDIPLCEMYPECKLDAAGKGYRGMRAETVQGSPCLPWAEVGYAEEEGSFCRNPTGEARGPWCYIAEGEWDYCDVPLCEPSEPCKGTESGNEYTGSRSMTGSGIPCQRWDHQTPHPHSYTEDAMFPDDTVEDAGNACRNPDASRPDGPWCYTRDSETEWGYCDIPLCEAEPKKADSPGVRHVLHIGLDGMHSECFLDASSGAENIMTRMAGKGSWTLNARTALETWSGPGWTQHVCGMDSETTGVTGNGWQAPWMGHTQPITPVTSDRVPLPCVFRHLKGLDDNVRTASFMNWRWIYWMGNRGAPGSVDVDWSCANQVGGQICDEFVVRNASDYLRNIAAAAEQSYTFLHIDLLDARGHGTSWCSGLYLNGVDIVDEWVGQLLDAVDDDEGEEWLVILSTDHGGNGFNHGAAADSDLLIPLFIRGQGVKQNHVFQTQVSNSDIVPTVAWAMGLDASPWWTGHVLHDAWE